MLKISNQQVNQRWDTLPDNLREVLFSEVNSDIVWKIGETKQLTEDKISKVATIAGDVVMGFLLPDLNRVSKEIQERTNIPEPLALEIAEELWQKIFSPLKADLEKVYRPVPETEVMPPSPPPPKSTLAPALGFPTTEAAAHPKPAPGQPDELESDQPFILHEEKPLFTPDAPPEKPSVDLEPPRPKKFFLKPKPVMVKIEEPEENEKARVVHYSNLRTPLDKDGKSHD